jgi:hypothetical protein
MAKVTPILYKHRQNASGERPIHLRVADAGKTRYVSLREYVRPSRWDLRQLRRLAELVQAEPEKEYVSGETTAT